MIHDLLSDPGPRTIISPYAIPWCWIPSGARLTADPRIPEAIGVTHFVLRAHLAEALRIISSGDVGAFPHDTPLPGVPGQVVRRGRSHHLHLIP